ncbi:hypothetical protein ACHAW6_000209 [Cyclotella cf. meneghiniana]
MFWLILCVLGFLAILIPGIVLGIPGLPGVSFVFFFPIGSAVYRLTKLVTIKKNSAPNSATGHRQKIIQPTPMPLTSSGIRVEALTEPYFCGALDVYNKFVGAGRKRLCCLVPLTLPTSMLDFQISFATENACSAIAVAVRESDDKVVGFVHMTDKSMDREFSSRLMHSLKDGECYIESMCVLSEVRNQGIGTRLLEFCEAHARERSAQCITLGLLLTIQPRVCMNDSALLTTNAMYYHLVVLLWDYSVSLGSSLENWRLNHGEESGGDSLTNFGFSYT